MNYISLMCSVVLFISNFNLPVKVTKKIDENTECNGNPACEVIKTIQKTKRVTKNAIETVVNDPLKFARDLGQYTGESYQNSLFGKINEFGKNYMGSYFDTVNGTEYNIFNCLASGGTSKACNLPNYDLKYDSGYRNYYNNDYMINTSTTGNYNTTYTNVVDYRNSKINYYNQTTNNWNYFDYRDYYYDITNNHYYYTDVNNYIYDIDYNYNYTTVNIINPDGNNQVTKNYWLMPTGQGSFNYTEESIRGYKLDYYVKKYTLMNNEEHVLGLYHLNNNILNSAVQWKTTLNNIYTSNWLSSGVGFGSYPNLGSNNDISISMAINQGDFSIEFRYYPYVKAIRNMVFPLPVSTRKITPNEERGSLPPSLQMWDGTKYRNIMFQSSSTFIDTNTWHTIKITRKNNETKLFVDGRSLSFNLYYIDSSDKKLKRGDINTVFKDFNLKYFWVLGGSNFGPIQSNDKDYNEYVNKLVEMNNYSWDCTSCAVNFTTQEGLWNIDEVIIKDVGEFEDYIPKSVEYDSTRIYTVPSNLDVVNNTVLIQSNTEIKGYQFGGIRPFDVENGFVFFYVDEQGFIMDVQQMEKGQWESISASVYSQSKLRWVNIIGSKIDDDYINPDAYSFDKPVSDTSIGFFQSWFNIFKEQFDSIIYQINNLEFPNSQPIINNDSDYINNNYETVYNEYNTLYVPNEESSDLLTQTKQEFRQKIGVFGQALDLADYTFNRVDSIEEESQGFEWEDIKYDDVVIIPKGNFNLKEFVRENGFFSTLYDIYLIIIDGLIYFGLFRMLYDKLMKILEK